MRPVSLEVTNILGCRHGYLDFTKQSVSLISGRNFQGKSSFLTGLQMALAGKKKGIFPLNPITDGEEEARIVLKLQPGENDVHLPFPCTIVRTLVRDDVSPEKYDTRLEIIEGHDEHDDEADRSGTPQTLLDDLAADGLAFEPLKFVHSKPTDQANILRALVGLDFTKLNADREKTFNRRAKINTEWKVYDGQIKGADLPNDVPSERIDVSETMARLEAANEHNRKLAEFLSYLTHNGMETDAAKQRVEVAKEELEQYVAKRLEEIKTQEEAISKLEQERAAAVKENENLESFDTEPIEKEILAASETNRLVDLQAQQLELREKRREKKVDADKLTAELKRIDKKKRDKMAKAKWPLPGLGFDAHGVTLNKIPMSSLSSAEQLRCAVAIQLSKNPQFPLAVLRDGSLLDYDSMLQFGKDVVDLKGDAIVERVGPEDCHVLFHRGIGKSPEEWESDPNGPTQDQHR